MNEDIEEMLKIYQTYEIDWMGDEIRDLSDLTRHHIVKRCKDGEDDINNYALLTTSSHRLLHYLEDNYYEAYIELNDLFLSLNRSFMPPTVDYYIKVRSIVKRVKKSIKNRRRK